MAQIVTEPIPAGASPSHRDSAAQASAVTPKTGPSTKFLLAVLVLLTALPYLPALGFGFVYDDGAQALGTVAAQASQTPAEFFFTSVWDFRHAAVTMNSRYYRPLFHTWLRINAALFGSGAAGWHLSSLAVHLAATILVFFLLRRHFQRPWAAFAGAAVFGVHPVHLESVAWISGVTDPLATVALLGSFLLWLKKVETKRFELEFCSLVCFAASVVAKENAIVLPGIVFLYAFWGQCGNIRILEDKTHRLRAAVWEALPFAGISAAYLGVRMAAIPSLRNASLPWVSHREAVLTFPSVLIFYLRHLVWPAGLTVFPDVLTVTTSRDHKFWVPLILLGAVAGCAWWLWRGKRTNGILAAGMVWLTLPLLPVLDLSVFFQDDFVHDRYLYLPSVGLAIFCAAAAEHYFDQKPARSRRWIGAAAATAVLLALAVSTVAQSFAWQSNVTLYSRAAQLSANPAPRIYLAAEYMDMGRLPEARDILQGVTQQSPESWNANYYLGLADYQLKDLPAAEIYFSRAIAIDPAEPDEYFNLGLTLFEEKRLGEAAAQLRSAIARNRDGQGYHYVLGEILLDQGQIEAGRGELREELSHTAEDAPLRLQIEQVLANTSVRSNSPAGSPAAIRP